MLHSNDLKNWKPERDNSQNPSLNYKTNFLNYLRLCLFFIFLFLGKGFAYAQMETFEKPNLIWKYKKDRPGVTYALDCGRFGDQLSNYMKTLWIAYTYDLNFLYKPFDYSDQLECSKIHLLLEDYRKNYRRRVWSSKDKIETRKMIHNIKTSNKKNTLYVISFSTPLVGNSEDEEFRKLLSKLIKPIHTLDLVDVPSDRISVAMHVRTGIGYDSANSVARMPAKFPPVHFYTLALQKIAEYFHRQPLYIYIFTDHPTPFLIRDQYIEILKELDIDNDTIIECRLSENRHDLNVLEDFFSMMKFDCLIRPNSSYSRSAAAISWPAIEIAPASQEIWPRNTPDKKDEHEDLVVHFRNAKIKKLEETYFFNQ